MSEMSASPPAAPPADPTKPARAGGLSAALWAALAVLTVAGVLGCAWQQREIAGLRRAIAGAEGAARIGALQTGALKTVLAGIQARLDALPDAWGLDRRITRLEQHARQPPPPPPDLQPELSALAARVARLEARPAPRPGAAPDVSGALAERVAQLEQRAQTPPAEADLTPLRAQLASLSQRLDALENTAMEISTRAKTAGAAASAAEQAVRWQQAALALREGRPLGTLPDTSPALQKFATAAPPTEAALRLAFPAAAQAALEASRPPGAGMGFAGRALRRMASLVTVREGDRLILGAPAAVALETARQKLEAGDLAGAVRTLDGLDPAAAAAMAEWRGRAQALLEARAALDAASG